MSKYLLIFLLTSIFCSCCAPKQTLETGYPGKISYNWKRPILGASVAAVSGASWGLHETLVHHYSRFEARYPNANRQYWDPRESWRNKYQGGDQSAGPAFPGSTTFLAWTTDAKHLFGTIHRTTLFSSAVVITLGERRPVWHYMADTGISFLAFSLGFHLPYSLGFRS